MNIKVETDGVLTEMLQLTMASHKSMGLLHPILDLITKITLMKSTQVYDPACDFTI